MKIRFTNPLSTKYGREEHVENTIGKTLIALGEAEAVPYKDFRERLRSENPTAFAPVSATVQWSVSKGAVNGRYYISAKCSQPNCSIFTFDGTPDSRSRLDTTYTIAGLKRSKRNLALEDITFTHSCGGGSPEKIPASVAAQYRKLFAPATTLGKDEAAYFHDARPQKSEPVDLKTWQYPLTGPLREGSEKEGLQNFLPNAGDGKPLDPAFYKYK